MSELEARLRERFTIGNVPPICIAWSCVPQLAGRGGVYEEAAPCGALGAQLLAVHHLGAHLNHSQPIRAANTR